MGILFLWVALGTEFTVHGLAMISKGTGGFEKLLHILEVSFAYLDAVVFPYLDYLAAWL